MVTCFGYSGKKAFWGEIILYGKLSAIEEINRHVSSFRKRLRISLISICSGPKTITLNTVAIWYTRTIFFTRDRFSRGSMLGQFSKKKFVFYMSISLSIPLCIITNDLLRKKHTIIRKTNEKYILKFNAVLKEYSYMHSYGIFPNI